MSGGGVSSGSSSGGVEKEKDSHWYFSSDQLSNSPSRRQGIDADTELSYRQMTAYLIQEMGQRLQVSQLCINTAIVYMHRFYAFHSFTHFHRNNIAAASLFLAAKVEEQPRKLEHVIKAANKCLSQPTSSTTDAYYIEQAQELVFNENVLLQTLGFDVAIDHPHTHVVKTCHLVKACKDLAQTSYFLASNSLHLTSMCLQYKPTVVACFCIYLACKWSRWEIPQSTEGKHWFHYVDKTVTMDLLKQLTDEFIAIYEKSPSRLKSKLNSIKALAQNASNRVINKDKKGQHEEWKMGDMMKMYAHDGGGSSSSGSNNNQTYGSTSLGIEPSQQSSSALLPPPPPQTQLSRKSDLHSSQHRSHHNTSSHHSKVNFPSTDTLDHKNSHKQQTFGGGVGRPRDHSQSAQGHQQSMIPSNSSRSSLSTSGGRPLNNVPAQNLVRQAAQGHQLDVNYHKSREKSNIMGPYPHTVPTQAHSVHKGAQKSDSNRALQKEQAAVKLAETTKNTNNSSGNNNKLFPPTSSLVAVPQYGSNTSQSQNKMDMGQDLSRTLMHGQRGYGVNNGSGSVPLLGSYQPQLSRQSSSGSNTNKHDISKATSVHLQPHGKPTSLQNETAYATGTHESQQSTLNPQAHSSTGYLNVRPSESLHNEDNSTQIPSVHGMLQPPGNINLSKTSMFSPEWNEKMQHQSQHLHGGTFTNSNVPPCSGGEAYNFKFTANKEGERDKGDRDRMDGNVPTLKKERNRGPNPGLDTTAPMMMGVRPNAAQTQFHQPVQQQALKITMPKKLDCGIIGDLTGLSSGIKRPNETVYKQEEEQNKMRKLDSQPALSSYSDIKPVDTSKLHVVNGIETNPDLVRSLLKESLCPSNALLKTEQLGTPSLQPPAELFEPSAMSISTMPPASETSLKSSTLNIGNEPTPMETTESSGSKAEKKKKKDKHKHKEKDKSKDREERKKHKKDKDKHKERDRGEMDSAEHVKIKISKDKIEGSGESLKIKIPKDRIISDMSSSSGNANDGGSSMHPAPALKIKISKDKLENYATESSSHSSSQQVHALAQPTTGFYSSFVTPNNASNTTSHSSSGSSGSGKKKDRDRDKDRERDKEKKRAGTDNGKSNGSGSFHSAITLQGGAGGSLLSHLPPTTTAPPKSQNPNKMQHLSNNMNQLFGESHDDDDDDYDDNNSGNHTNFKDYHKNRTHNAEFTSTVINTTRKTSDYGPKYSQHHMQR